MAVEHWVANWVDVAGDYREQAAVVHLDVNRAAPALIAAEALWGDDARAVGVGTQPDAHSAWEQRRSHLLIDRARSQQYLGTFAEDAP